MQVSIVVWLRRVAFATAILATAACLSTGAPDMPPASESDDAPKILRIGDDPPDAGALSGAPTASAAPVPDKLEVPNGGVIAPPTLPEPPASALNDDKGALPDDRSADEKRLQDKLQSGDRKLPSSDAANAVAKDLQTQADDEGPKEIHVKGNGTASKAHEADEPLKPIPTAPETGPVAIEAASFKGVTPGVTTIAEVEKEWGLPKEMRKHDGLFTQLFSVAPFEHVEVSYYEDKVTSIIIRLGKMFPAAGIAEQLELTRVRPVLVSNDVGEILGQVYAERGVLFAFAPSEEPPKPSMKVTQIILEPINAEPFVLRAETNMESDLKSATADLEQALKLQADNARALWLYSQMLTAVDQQEKALAACSDAVTHEPDNARFRVTRAQILSRLGRVEEAIDEAEKAVDSSAKRPHVRARALCLVGDLLAEGAKPDFKESLRFYMEAIQTADSLKDDAHPAVRLVAKEVLVDAHLGAAQTIAWGEWKEKEPSVKKWLGRAAVFADDLVRNEGSSAEQSFRVNTRALAVCAGMRGALDPKPWCKDAIRIGDELIAANLDELRKAQVQWDLGIALYDALQVCQMRDDHQAALKYGQEAVVYLEQGERLKQPANGAYVMGKLYFRLGAIHAVREQNHRAAVAWFDKAVPLLEKPLPQEVAADLGRQGESLVSMGVSYWETGDREKAVVLTEEGVGLLEEAVKQGLAKEPSLAIPYGNLAAMNRQLGADAKAERFRAMATKLNDTKLK